MTAQEWKDRFAGRELPAEMRLDAATVITNPRKFIDSHIAVIENSPSNHTFRGFAHRLEEVWAKLDQC